MMPPHAAAPRSSQAQRLQARWEMFRRETNTLYDTLMWQPLEWPCLTLQWQPTAWQPPQHILDEQHAAAEAAERAALGLDSDTDEDSHHSAVAAAAGTDHMDIDSAAAAAGPSSSSSHGSQDNAQADSDILAMPFEYQYIVTGEQTSGQEPSKLMVWRVSLLGPVPGHFDPDRHQLAMARGEIEPVMVIPYGQQDVNRLHIMPQNTNILAACSDDPEVHLYDLTKNLPLDDQPLLQQRQQQRQHSGSQSPARSLSGSGVRTGGAAAHVAAVSEGDQQQQQQQRPPELTAVLGGRSTGGFGLEFNPVHEGLLLGADVQGCVQLWDVGSGSSSNGSSSGSGVAIIQPVQVVNGFAGCSINDISWHSSGNTFAAATERGQLGLQDIRAGPAAALLGVGFGSNLRTGQLHVQRSRAKQPGPADADCLSVDFDPNHSYRLASGGKDGFVYVTDMRKLDSPLERLPLHAGDVRHVSWSRGAPGLLASAGEDGHVLLWDVHKMKNSVMQQKTLQFSAAAAAGRSGSAAPPASAAAAGKGLGLPQPRTPSKELSDAIRQLSVPGLLFLHHGHLSAVEQVAWNPDRPWMLASVSDLTAAHDSAGQDVEVQPSTLMVWEVNRSAGLLC